MSTVEAQRGGRRRADTRRRLVAAAYEVFAERGIADAPVEAICERAGFTRGAFYSNFASKEDLFLALFREKMRAKQERLAEVADEVLERRAIGDVDTLRDAIAEMARLFFGPFDDDTAWYLLVAEFRAQSLRQPALLAQAEAIEAEARDGIAGALTGAFDRLGMRFTMPATDVVPVLIGCYEAAIRRSLVKGIESPGEDDFVARTLPDLLTALITRR